MSDRVLQPLSRSFSAEFAPTGSKSHTNRALVLTAMADGVSELNNCLFADDTLVMIDSLRRLGFVLDVDQASARLSVHGLGGRIPAASADLACGNSGTSIRFLTALCSLGKGDYRLDGVARMRERPIGQLVEMLRNLGVRIGYLSSDGFPPIQVQAHGLPGGIARFANARSSQYLSAVLQVCPLAKHEVKVDLDGEVTSWPYVAMTMQLMDHFGVMAELLRDKATGLPKQIVVPREPYRACRYDVEPDASNASYFLALAALHKGSKITLRGLGKHSLQGDVGFGDVLHRMGAGLVFGRDFITIMGADHLEGIDIDLRDMPDTAQTLAVVALFADGPTTIRGLHTLRVKETDRIAALAAELTKLGADVDVDGDTLSIQPPERFKAASIATYDDHRMAMSFSLAGTKVSGVTIQNAECVNKTYPGYFDDLARLTAVE
ncbi:MAG: 3-phosphoshikimate 1-carboxyvinyltransferase [Tepidisphaeraceae bacterium]